MEPYALCAPFQGSPAEGPDEARLVLRRAVQKTLAGLAEMDRLLDRAERLISRQQSGALERTLDGLIDPVC